MEVSKVWKYFKKNKDAASAQCQKCPKTIACKGSNTSGLVRHLAHVHKINIKSETQEESESEATTSSGVSAPKKARSGSESMQQQKLNFKIPRTQSLGEILAKLAAKDGFTINGITKSEFIRDSLSAKGHKLPLSVNDVMNLILKYYEEKEKEMVNELSDICSSGNRLSVSIDEWTSIRNKRYFSVICHTTEATHYNLGLVYIPGKCGATEVRQIVEERLKHFGVKFESDVVAVTSDGPNVMKKFGRESPCEMVLCINHAIHLAILDTFCKKQSDVTAARNASHSDDGHSSSDEASSTENDDEFNISNEEARPQIVDDINNVMSETRSIIRFFRKSPLNTIALQKHVVAEFGVELVLLLDVRTRWNSMLTMIERFLKLKNAIKKALIDLNSSQKWNEDNIAVVQKLQMILTPTKLAVEALSRQDANILTAEAIIDVLLKKLESIDDPLALKLVDSLKLKISERRNTPLISLIKYLNSPDNFSHNKSSYFIDNNKTFLIGYAEKEYNRLYPTTTTLTEMTENESELVEVSPSEPEPDSFESQLEKAIKGVSTNEEASAMVLSKSIIKKEFLLFEQTGKRSPNLESLYKALLSVKPTSTENERVFSISGNVVNKIRNRLSDKAINALVFLKAYFIRQSKLT